LEQMTQANPESSSEKQEKIENLLKNLKAEATTASW